MENDRFPAPQRSVPGTRRRLVCRSAALVLIAAALVPLDPAVGPVAADTLVPATSVDEVASEGAEPVLTLIPDLWAPASGAMLRWTVGVENLDVAAASAGSPSVFLNSDGGLVFEEVEGPLPDGWNIGFLSPSSVQVTIGASLEPGESAQFVLRSTVTAGSDHEVGVSGAVTSQDQWRDTPRAGSNAGVMVVVDGVELSGTVVAATSGAPLRSVCVDAQSDGGDQFHTATTRSDGAWNLSVRNGPGYRVRADPGCQTERGSGVVTPYASGWYPGGTSGSGSQPIEPSVDGPDLGTAQLGPGGAVSGTVTVPDGSDPTRIWVSIDDADTGWWTAGSSPSADGTYLVQGVPAGQHVARFQDNDGVFATHFFDDASRRSAATPFGVQAGSVTTGIDVAMVAGASIEGVVTAAATGEPLAGIAVVVRDPDGDWVGSSTTGADGTYSVAGLAEGSYRVRFEDDDRNYVWVFHDGAWTWSSSEPEFLAAGTTWELDAAMSTGSTVTGRVTAAVDANGLSAGDPIPGVVVLGWIAPVDFDADPVAFAVTDDNGDYVLSGVPPTGVDVLFIHGLPMDDDGGDDDDNGGEFADAEWAAQFWQGANQPADATSIDVSSGPDPRTGIDAALVPAPVLSGRVLDAAGGTLADAVGVGQVAVGLFLDGDDEPLVVAFTEADGSFELRTPFIGVATHLLTVDITDAHDGAYPPLWFGNVPANLGEEFAIDPSADGAAIVSAPPGGLADLYLTYDPPDPPLPVSGVAVTAEGSDLVVTWPPAAGVVDHYAVLVDGVELGRVPAVGSAAGGLSQSVVASSLYRYVASGLVPGQQYQVSVIAANLGGSAQSAPVSATAGGNDAGTGPTGPGPGRGEPDGTAPSGAPTTTAGPTGGPAATPPAASGGPAAESRGATPPESGGRSPARLALTGIGVVPLVLLGLGLIVLGSASFTSRRRVAGTGRVGEGPPPTVD